MKEGARREVARSGTAAAVRARSGLRPELEDERGTASGRLGRGLAICWAGPVRWPRSLFLNKHFFQTKRNNKNKINNKLI